jgi:hypothetical protein
MGSAKRVGWKQSTRFHLLKIKESRSQRPEARGQRPEARGQRPEARGQRPEARGQRPEEEELLVKCYWLWGKSMKKLLFYLLSSVSFSSVSFRRKVLPEKFGGFCVGFRVHLRA